MVESKIEAGSTADDDKRVQRLFEWVRENGGVCNVETRMCNVSGARGLYSAKEITDDEEPIV
jgi:hypothetical protein